MTAPELIEALVLPRVREMQAYSPDPGRYAVRLDANEAPHSFSEDTQELLRAATRDIDLRRYPDAGAASLRKAIADYAGADADQVLVGVGSDEVIAMLQTVLAHTPRGGPATAVTSTPTFVMYKMSAKVRGWRVIEVPLDSEWRLDAASMHKAIEFGQPNLVFVATPNNPTGTLTPPETIRELAEAWPHTLFVVDEAYLPYAGDPRNYRALARSLPNIARLGTLSKMGFASLRVGWLVADRALIAELNKARQPYNLSALSQAVAEVALTQCRPALDELVNQVRSERTRLTSELGTLAGVSVTPSEANFVWVNFESGAETVFEALKERGILVRSFHRVGGRLRHQLRVTVGTAEENDRLLSELASLTR